MRRPLIIVTVAALIAAGLVVKAIVPSKSDAAPGTTRTTIANAKPMHGLLIATPPDMKTFPNGALPLP